MLRNIMDVDLVRAARDDGGAANSDLRGLYSFVASRIGKMELCSDQSDRDEGRLWVPHYKRTIEQPEAFESIPLVEARILGCALYVMHTEGRDFSAADVLILTRRFAGSPMILNTVYRGIDDLVAKGLIASKGLQVNERSNKASQHYEVTANGRRALQLALMLSNFIHECRVSQAA